VLALLLLASTGCSESEGPLCDGALLEASADGAGDDGGETSTCAPSASLLARVDGARMRVDLEALVGLGERRSYTSQTRAAAYIQAQLSPLSGIHLREQSYSHLGQTYVNLEATIAGELEPETFVFVGAHYDSVSDDPLVAPGADDDASGTATVLEIARALAGCRPRRSIRLLFFSNEESDIAGSTAYVESIKTTLPADRLVGFINVDMVAFGPAAEDLDLATRPAYASLADAVGTAVEQWSALDVKPIIDEHCG